MEQMPHGWDFDEFRTFLLGQCNDLTKCAAELTDKVQDVLNALREQGSDDADMSGSGSTCWGLFETESSARLAAEAIAQDQPDWWVRTSGVS